MNNPAPNRFDLLVRIAAIITSKDPEVLARAPLGERIEVLHDWVALLLLGIFELALWTFALTALGWPVVGALPCALVIALIILCMDIRLTSSDNAPRGVLRRGRPDRREQASRLGTRLLIAVFASAIPAAGAHIAMFRDEAIVAQEEDRHNRNAPIIAQIERRIAALRQERLGAVNATIDQLVAEREALITAKRQSDEMIASSFDQRQTADLERSRQLSGLGDREKGDGVLAQDAKFRAAQAEEQIAAARKDAERITARIAIIDQEVPLNEQIRSRLLRELEPEIARLREEGEARLEKSTDGIVTAALGVQKLHSDPGRSFVMWALTLMVYVGILFIEMSFFIRLMFKPASVYDALLTIDRQLFVARASHSFSSELANLRERTPLRVIPRDQAANS